MMASNSPLVTMQQHSLSFPCTSPSVSQLFHKPRISWSLLFLLVACIVPLAAAASTASPQRAKALELAAQLLSPEPPATDAASAAPKYTMPARILPPVDAVPMMAGDTLLIDARTPLMEKGRWDMVSEEELAAKLKKRKDQASPTTSSVTGTPTSTNGTDSTTTVSITPPTTTAIDIPSPLPTPFDSSLSYNFTTNNGKSCPAFINDMLANPAFKACYPLSMLLQGSRSFFEAEKKLLSIVRVLDASCSANVTFCTPYLQGVAKNLTSSANCANEYNTGNSVVVMAYEGLMAYNMLYSATCLQDPETSMYCFANAVTNLTTPSNAYIYFLPVNMTLPATATPGCDWCLQQTMGIFQAATSDRQQAIAWTYRSAARQINSICGPEFVNDTLPAEMVVSLAGTTVPPWAVTLVTVGAAIVANWLL